jgi:hypothetical protein
MTACPATRPVRPLILWLIRGAVGIAVLTLSVSIGDPLVIIAALVIAVFAFGGCPMCWIFGLIERASALFGGRSAP